MDVERHNWRQIEMLNQRGGRTLSIVDLIRAGTISAEMAAYAMRAMHRGASLLTGARPSGAGKTSLMAALLGFLPPETPVATVDSAEVVAVGLAQPADMPVCYLVHEIGFEELGHKARADSQQPMGLELPLGHECSALGLDADATHRRFASL